jgi:hypothetical protein
MGIGRPPCTVTPREKPISLMAIWPWSWYMVTMASYWPSRARRKMVSAGNGPSTGVPRGAQRLHRRGDDVDLLAAAGAAVAVVRVEGRHRHARLARPLACSER